MACFAQLYDVYETSQHIFLVLERVKGGELFDYILQKGRLPRPEALRIMSQIVQGVEFCHMHSICHRDIKPENLLLDENLNIKMADFGMAQIAPGEKVLDTFCGSPHYGAPEVVSGIRYDGRVSDVWSMGVVFYALITGMLPFDNPNISTLLKMVKRGVYHMPKWVPEDIADCISRMLTSDVDKRIKTPEIKYHRCWLGEHGTNLYYPLRPVGSPALEFMKLHPIRSEADIDFNILRDLEGLGWGDSNQLKHKLLTQRSESLHNLETVFYMMIAARNHKREQENRHYDDTLVGDEPQSPMPVSFAAPSSPASGRGSAPQSPASANARRRVSETSTGSGERAAAQAPPALQISPPPAQHEAGSAASASSPASAAATAAEGEGSGGAAKKDRPNKFKQMSIQVNRTGEEGEGAAAGAGAGAGGEAKHEYSTTPRFHRLKLVSSNEDVSSPAPITPTAKRSWFKALFRRRPSVDMVAKHQQHQGSSGMYSEKDPTQLLKGIQKTLNDMGVTQRVSSSSDYELKCEAMCYLEPNYSLVIIDKSNQVVFHSEEAKDEGAPQRPPPAALAAGLVQPESNPSSPRSPTSPRSPRDPSRAQLVKFTVDVLREPNDKVSMINFNHRAGDLLVYRALYTEIIKLVQL
jgi:BR serine/threonine kinase